MDPEMLVAEQIQVEEADGIRTLTINRPEARNAISSAMRGRLCSELAAADKDSGVHAVVLGAADPAFTAGLDFKEVAAGGTGTWNYYDAQFAVNPGKALRAMTKPVICSVNGACVSGGLEIALSSSFIVASERARFADTHARLGVVATWGLTALLPRAVGIRKAREMAITGNFMDAEEALRLGLVNHVVAHDELREFTHALAMDIVRTSVVPDVLRLFDRGSGCSLAEALSIEVDHVTRQTLDPAMFEAGGRASAARARPAGDAE